MKDWRAKNSYMMVSVLPENKEIGASPWFDFNMRNAKIRLAYPHSHIILNVESLDLNNHDNDIDLPLGILEQHTSGANLFDGNYKSQDRLDLAYLGGKLISIGCTSTPGSASKYVPGKGYNMCELNKLRLESVRIK